MRRRLLRLMVQRGYRGFRKPDCGLIAHDDPEALGPVEEVGERRNIVLLVFSPRHPDAKPFRFPVEETVGAAATAAAKSFGYEAGTPTFKRENGSVLDRNLTLEAAGLHQREHVELVDAGGGV